MSRACTSLFFCLTFATCATASSQFKTDAINDKGANLPCIGIGPGGGPVAKKCVELLLQAGFLKRDDVGFSGLTIGTSAAEDSVITAVAPNSPAAQAGLKTGDTILTVEGKSIQPTREAMAAKAIFGPNGEPLHLKIKRSGTDVDVSLVRASQPPPPSPFKSPGFFYAFRVLADWRGTFAPCLGAGAAAMGAVAICESKFKPFGYIKVGDLGTTGIHFVPGQATIASLEPGSSAAGAGLKAGDEIFAVEGKPLAASSGELAKERLFARAGESRHLTVHSGDADKTVVITLAAKPAE